MRRLVLLSAMMTLGWTASVSAQVHIRGRVIDNESLRPIPAVEVLLSKAGYRWRTVARTVSDRDGRFEFHVSEAPGYVFRASSIGFEDTETPILWIDDYRSYEVEIRLDPDAVLLAPIEVLARAKGAESPVLAGFSHRLEAGFGHYITHLDIQRLKPSRVTDLLARVPGVRLESSGAGLRRTVYLSRSGTDCQAEIFVDGMLWTRPVPNGGPQLASSVDDAVSPAVVLGIEVYRGLATVPAEFLTPRARCGVVAIWTRR